MMKKILCVMLCLMLMIPAASAETADTLPKLLARQLTAGYGLRGYADIDASGVAEWLNYLLPFTPADIQIRAIGEKQGEVSAVIDDDDDWQIRFYVENSAEEEVGTTWLYGDPNGIYFQSELLPGEAISLPVENVHLLYQLMRGEFDELFFAFDPMNLRAPVSNGNASSYEAIANLLGIPADEWDAKWLPVLNKYLLHIDLWLAGYGDSSFVNGEAGKLTMSGTYTIPAADLKREAKYLIGQMLYDVELQNLLLPYVTLEQRITYLNPSLVYYYEACIDALPLEGDIVLAREMSAMGDIVSTTVSLPIPALPDKLTAPIGQTAQALFGLSCENILSGMNRITLTQFGNEISLTISGTQRSIELQAADEATDENAMHLKGALRITPEIGVDENYMSAAFSLDFDQRIWQDESYNDHDTTTFAVSFAPDLTSLEEDDLFRNVYTEFSPVSLALTVDYRNDPYKANSPVQVNVDVAATLPDAEVSAKVVLRVTTKLEMQQLSHDNTAENLEQMTETRKSDLLESFISNAIITMANLNTSVQEDVAATTVPPSAE